MFRSLLHPREPWRSIVMSTSVCLCVCERISRITRAIFTKCFVHVAYRRGSVLLRCGDAMPRRRGDLGGFLPHWQRIVQHSMLNPYKNGWIDRHAVLDEDSGGRGPTEPCVRWGVQILQGEGTIVGSCPGHSKALEIFARRCKRDHSVCQASANISLILKISGRMRCGLSAAKGVVGLHSSGEVWYWRLPLDLYYFVY